MQEVDEQQERCNTLANSNFIDQSGPSARGAYPHFTRMNIYTQLSTNESHASLFSPSTTRFLYEELQKLPYTKNGNTLPRHIPFFSCRPHRRRSGCNWPCQIICVLLTILALVLLAVLAYGGLPPSYSRLRAEENALPQHHWEQHQNSRFGQKVNVDINTPQQDETPSTTQYLRFPDGLWGLGLNNILEERILLTHLTLSITNRTPVFEDYVWSKIPLPYTLYDFALRPTKMPFGSFVGGILSGQDSADETDSTPNGNSSGRKAVSATYFDYVCPPSEIFQVMYKWPTLVTDSLLNVSVPRGMILNQAQPLSKPASDPSPTYAYKDHRFPSRDADGSEILRWFKDRMDAPDVRGKRCVVVREEERKIFFFDFFGGKHMLAMLPELISSPVLKQFQWSALVRNAIKRNIQRYFGILGSSESFTVTESPVSATNKPTASEATSVAVKFSRTNTTKITSSAVMQRNDLVVPTINGTLPGVLALHLRRGDYKGHCRYLNSMNIGYMGVLGILQDKFDVANEERQALREDERKIRRENYYLKHCLPSIEQVVRRLRRVREDYEVKFSDTLATSPLESDEESASITERRKDSAYALKQVYILTNAWPSFLSELRAALVADGWERVVGTPELEAGLTKEEKGVDAAIDMGIAERAQAFVGNGFSSMSANIVMLRLARGFAVDSNRLL